MPLKWIKCCHSIFTWHVYFNNDFVTVLCFMCGVHAFMLTTVTTYIVIFLCCCTYNHSVLVHPLEPESAVLIIALLFCNNVCWHCMVLQTWHCITLFPMHCVVSVTTTGNNFIGSNFSRIASGTITTPPFCFLFLWNINQVYYTTLPV